MKSPIYSLKIVDRYLLLEIIPPFLFGVFIFLSIFLVDILMELTNMVINKGVPGIDVMKFFIYSLPALIVLVFPMGLLLGVVISLGRLASDAEITALKASGLSFVRIVMPLIIFSILLSMFSFFVNEYIVPLANRKRAMLQRQILLKKPVPQFIEGEFKKNNKERAIYTRSNKNGKLKDIIMLEFKNNELPMFLSAKNGMFDGNNFVFKNGYWYIFDKAGDFKRQLKFQKMLRPLKMEVGAFQEGAKSPREMSFFALRKKIKEYRKMGLNVKNMIYELYMKTSLPVACLVFVLLGAPLSFVPSRNSKAIGTGLSIIIIFFYYILLSAGKALYITNAISPFFGAWLPNFIVGAIGVVLVWKARR